jgi:hypothetical protein
MRAEQANLMVFKPGGLIHNLGLTTQMRAERANMYATRVELRQNGQIIKTNKSDLFIFNLMVFKPGGLIHNLVFNNTNESRASKPEEARS